VDYIIGRFKSEDAFLSFSTIAKHLTMVTINLVLFFRVGESLLQLISLIVLREKTSRGTLLLLQCICCSKRGFWSNCKVLLTLAVHCLTTLRRAPLCSPLIQTARITGALSLWDPRVSTQLKESSSLSMESRSMVFCTTS